MLVLESDYDTFDIDMPVLNSEGAAFGLGPVVVLGAGVNQIVLGAGFWANLWGGIKKFGRRLWTMGKKKAVNWIAENKDTLFDKAKEKLDSVYGNITKNMPPGRAKDMLDSTVAGIKNKLSDQASELIEGLQKKHGLGLVVNGTGGKRRKQPKRKDAAGLRLLGTGHKFASGVMVL